MIDLLAGAALVIAVRRGERYVEPVAQAMSRGLQRLERIANPEAEAPGCSGSAVCEHPDGEGGAPADALRS